jgi:hypothetical protein
MDVDGIVEAFGGTGKLAAALRVNKSLVSSWKARGYVPASNWYAILALARRRGVKGITLQVLADLLPRKRSARA